MDFKVLDSYNKENLLKYYRARTKEYYSEIEKTYSKTDFKKRASAINQAVITIRETGEIVDYISTLPLSEEQKSELISYYEKVRQLVTSGDIKLELDLHFIQGNSKYVVDYKSGFHSNEKGNTNRLLLVVTLLNILVGKI